MTEKTAKKVAQIIRDEADVDLDGLRVTYDEDSDNIVVLYKSTDASCVENDHDVIVETLLAYDLYEVDSQFSGLKGKVYFEQ